MSTVSMVYCSALQDQVFHYLVDPTWSSVTGEVSFSGFENMLSKIVVEFFIVR